MSTRTAIDDSFHQGRYASSPAFERGLIANLVAKRCEMLDDKTDRELIWFVQYLSHQPGGIAAVAAELIARFSDRLGTATMAKSRKDVYQSEEVKKIRRELPNRLRRRFAMRGETDDDIRAVCGQGRVQMPYELRKLYAERERELMSFAEAALSRDLDDLPAVEARKLAKAANNPASYPALAIIDLCWEAAVNGFDDENDTDNLEKELCRLCLDPGGISPRPRLGISRT